MTRKKNILFIVSRLPINIETGDRLRVYHFIKKLAERGHQVDILGFVPEEKYSIRTDIDKLTHQCIGVKKKGLEFKNPDRARQLRQFISSFFHGFPYRVWQWHNEKFIDQARQLVSYHEYDVVHFSEIVTAEVLNEVEKFKEKPRIVFDLIDSVALSLSNALERKKSPLWPFRFVEQRRLKKFEQHVAKNVDKAVLISKRDKNFLKLDEVMIIPNGIEENELRPRTRDIDLLFTGNMAAEPNVDAVQWFAREILPKLQRERDGLNFTIAGANPPKSVKSLEGENVTVTGFVQDMNEYYRRAKLFVCPMRMGAGQKNKILEAMINHTPVISTAEANIGVDAPAGAIAIADDAESFANTVGMLLEDKARRDKLAESGYEFVRKTFSWEKSTEMLERCYEA